MREINELLHTLHLSGIRETFGKLLPGGGGSSGLGIVTVEN